MTSSQRGWIGMSCDGMGFEGMWAATTSWDRMRHSGKTLERLRKKVEKKFPGWERGNEKVEKCTW